MDTRACPASVCRRIRKALLPAFILALVGAVSAPALEVPAGAASDDTAVRVPWGDSTRPPSLTACLAYAEKMNPMLAASRDRWDAAVARADRVRSLPDPMVTFSHYIDEVETRVGPQKRRIALRQAFPFFGKLRLRGEMARAEADAEYQRHRAVQLGVAFEVTSAFVEYAHLAEALRIVSIREELLRQLEAVTTQRYANGDASYSDVMRAQMELARVRNDRESLSALRGASSSRGPMRYRMLRRRAPTSPS
jgi:cobalt-zinc-cadmium efflux system outer membrane protein